MKSLRIMTQKVGHLPGTLIDNGLDAAFSVIDYSPAHYDEFTIEHVDQLPEQGDSIRWIRSGTGPVVLEQVGALFGIHPLVLEDIQNHGQRPKVEDYGNYVYMVLKTVHGAEDGTLEFDQISMVIGANWIVTFYKTDTHLFEPLIQRIKTFKGKICKNKADFLCYAISDYIIDQYFLVLEQTGEQIESFESEIITNPNPNLLHKLKTLKTQMLFFRKAVWPVRDMINELERGEASIFTDETLVYFRDVQDHVIQIIDTVETYRDIISGILDIYLSSISYKLNEIMKLLTIISTIFIPLSFLASLWGMNYKNMPELDWTYGYPMALSIMAGVALSLMMFFKRKNWL